MKGADVQAQRGFAVEKSRRTLHVAADAQGRSSSRGDRNAFGREGTASEWVNNGSRLDG